MIRIRRTTGLLWVLLMIMASLGTNARAPAEPTTIKSSRWVVQLETIAYPDAGCLQAAAIDAPRKRLLLWGGVSPKQQPSRVLTAVSLDTAKPLAVALEGDAPEGCAAPAMTMDGKRQTAYVFGGWAKGAAKPSDALFRVQLDAKTPRWERLPVDKVWPPARNGSCCVEDPKGDTFFLFAGDGGPGDDGFTPLGDLWRYDLATTRWQAVRAQGSLPPPRWHAQMTCDPVGRKAYLFGGAGLGRDAFDRRLYELDLQTFKWRILESKGEGPPSLQGASLTFDAEHRALVLVGGLRHEKPGDATLADIWVFDLADAAWERLDGGDSVRRRDHGAGYDSATRRHYLVGGRVSQEVGNFYQRGDHVGSVLSLKLERRR